MKALIVATLAALALMLGACSPAAQPTQPTQYFQQLQAQPTAAQQCEEDMPCWDCHTMGNKLCGPQPTASATPAPTASPKASQPKAVAPAATPAPTVDDVNAQLAAESTEFAKSPYIPTDERQTVTYVSLTTSDRTDGDVLWSVQSRVDPTLWHTYHVALTPTVQPAIDTIKAAPQPAPKQAPKAAPQRAQQPKVVKAAPKPAKAAQQPAQPKAATQPVTGAGMCMRWKIRMGEYNAAHPDNPATAGQPEKFCTDWWK